MRLQHFIITRFCIRWAGRGGPGSPSFFRGVDPLEPSNVDLRLRLLDILSRPAVAAQSNVEWVVVVDPALPCRSRARLEARLADIGQVHLHTIGPQDDLHGLGWLEPYLAPETTHVLTSNLDDDDAFGADFATTLQDEVRARAARGALPDAMTLGTRSALEWDLVPRPLAPFGYVKPWHRDPHPSSCGCSLLSTRALDVNVMGLRHRFAQSLMDTSVEADNLNVQQLRAKLRPVLERWPAEALYYDFGARLRPVVMSNHFANDQATRLYEAAAARRRVRTVDDLAGAPVDLSAYLRNCARFTRFHPAEIGARISRRLF